MILEGAEEVSNMLSDARITALTANANWELAEKEATPPFINFTIRDEGPSTKNKLYKIYTDIRVFGKSMTEAAQIAKVIREVAKENNYYDRGGSSGYTDTSAKEGFVQVTFEFNLKKQ